MSIAQQDIFFLTVCGRSNISTVQCTIEQLRNELNDAHQRHIRAESQIGEIEKENIFLKEKIHAFELEIETLKIKSRFFQQINSLQ
jgi:chromosome segregation ATPase